MSKLSSARPTRAVRYLRILMVILATALPVLSLTVLGSLWLWQNGYVLIWALAAFATSLTAFAIERWALRDAFTQVRETSGEAEEAVTPKYATEREELAWQAVLDLQDEIEPASIDNRDALIDLGKRTVETVAKQMHPGHKDPLLKFTLPEMLALVERVSADLAPFVRDNIPLGDRLTVGQFLAIYRWRGILGVADKAYDIWRIIRMLNPATAVTQELRERITRHFYDWGRQELARRLTTAYISEVGRASIDLYSGRLRVADDAVGSTVDDEAAPSEVLAHNEVISPPATATQTPVKKKRGRLAPVGRVLRQTGNAAKFIWQRNKKKN